jgi:hypothetical protein
VQIGEQHLASAQFFALGRERLLHLHDQLGAAIDGVGIGHDRGARGFIIGVRQACPGSCTRLDHNLVALVGELAHRRRHDADAVFVVLDFLGHADQHGDLICCREPAASHIPRKQSAYIT